VTTVPAGIRRALVAAAAAVAALISLAVVPAAADVSQSQSRAAHAYCSKTKKVTTTALIAGSSHFLAYALGKKKVLKSGNQIKESNCRLPKYVGKAQYLWVRSRSGKTRNLGRVPAYIAGAGGTLIGSMLYDVSVGYNTPPGFVPHLYWWNAANGRHGKLPIPDGYIYQGGSPGGFLLSRDKTLYVESTTGQITEIGVPFPDTDDPPGLTYLRASATKRGIVAIHLGDFAYMRFARPDHWNPLDARGKGLICPTLSRTSLGCYSVADDDSGMKHQRTELVRLNGGKPVIDKSGGGLDPALAGDVLMYWADGGPKSFSPEAPNPIQGPAQFQPSEERVYAIYGGPYEDLERDWIAMTSALGGVVLVTVPRTKVMIFTDAKHYRTLFRVPGRDH
jgi:hypothetical protein